MTRSGNAHSSICKREERGKLGDSIVRYGTYVLKRPAKSARSVNDDCAVPVSCPRPCGGANSVMYGGAADASASVTIIEELAHRAETCQPKRRGEIFRTGALRGSSTML